jgi:hypothetical protein
MFKNINLKDKLDQERKGFKTTEEDAVVSEAIDILLDDICRETAIKKSFAEGPTADAALPDPELFQKLDIYEIEDIKRLSIKYRLRFLGTDQFEGEIPHEALIAVKNQERCSEVKLKNFKILAPSEMFALEDCDKDPILFAELSDGRYLFLHQWGGDLSSWRLIASWPLRNIRTLAFTIFSVSLLISLFFPTELVLSGEVHSIAAVRFAFFAWTFVCISAVVTYIGFAFFKSLSVSQWKSPFFKHNF